MPTRFTLPLTLIATAVALLPMLHGAVGAGPIPAPALVTASLHSEEPPAQKLAPALARARLETLGFSLDPDTFVKVVAAQYPPLTELFLCAGVGLDGRDAQGRSALFVAAATRQWTLAEALLRAGADPQTADSHGRTALMATVLNGQTDFALRLLDHGAAPAASDENAHTALHFAIMTKQQPLIARLLSVMPALPGVCCPNHDALETRSWSIIGSILQRLPSQPLWRPETSRWLVDAVTQGDRDRIRFLLSKHSTPPVPAGLRQPLLAYAYMAPNRDCFNLLLECGADPNCSLNTPAEPAFLNLIPPGTVRQYLAQEPGMTLLMLAAGLGRAEDLKLLLAQGAKRGVATNSKYKLVALYFAAWAESADAQQVLLVNSPPADQLRIEISLGQQRASLFKNGAVLMNTNISTGRPGFSTPQGRFVVTDKHLTHRSTLYPAEMPFFMRLSCRAFGLHEGNASSPYASHGCIRVPAPAARRLFQEVPVGTVVQIGP